MSPSEKPFPKGMPEKGIGTVFFVGAGPGNPGLVTIRAAQILEKASLVIYDRLVSQQVLDLCQVTAVKLCAETLPGCHPERIPSLTELLIEKAKAGISVVRLKGGDPLLFGRGAEEIEPIASAGIPFEIVPGITAALGASAYAGILLTDRRHASAVAFVTGHEKPDKEDSLLDWKALAGFPGTLVFYMGIARVKHLTTKLLENGMPGNTLVAIVSWATMGKQKVHRCRLVDLPMEVERNKITPPGVIITGQTLALPDLLNWRTTLPLNGANILLARPKGQNKESSDLLTSLGADVISIPSMEIANPHSWIEADKAIADLNSFDWIIFTSVNGVRQFVSRLIKLGFDLRKLGKAKLAAIGPTTGKALEQYYLNPDFIPAEFSSEGLAQGLLSEVRDKKILLIRAEQGRPVLNEELGKLAQVTQVAVYSQTPSRTIELEKSFLKLDSRDIDYIIITSSNVAKNLAGSASPAFKLAIRSGKTKIVSISPVTSGALREIGWEPSLEARDFTFAGITSLLIDDWGKRKG